MPGFFMLHLCQSGYESLLARELAQAGRAAAASGPGWVREAGAGREPGDLAFAHASLLEPVELRGESAGELAQALADFFGASLQGERVDGPWPLVFAAAGGTTGLGKRAAAAERGCLGLLAGRLPRVAKLAVPGWPTGLGPARGLFVWLEDFGRAWASREAWRHGARRMADDPAAPSRSYLKVEEAYGLLGAAPRKGETVADLGAAPGGWSYSAARRGASVVAVDNGPLKAGALSHPGIEHRREDAFRFRPAAPFDWLFCDLVADPRRVLAGIVGPWLERGGCRRFVVNLKFGQVDPLALLAELRAPSSVLARFAPGCRIQHLYHDREELTVVGAPASMRRTP
ncbi:MAG TPA: SAM-dependent methyltransferase [Opitutaceae bacterium]|nr:SAM-dependent methyltransferase [Opitutaceae bacterium]